MTLYFSIVTQQKSNSMFLLPKYNNLYGNRKLCNTTSYKRTYFSFTGIFKDKKLKKIPKKYFIFTPNLKFKYRFCIDK